jgi:hypothetical protein
MMAKILRLREKDGNHNPSIKEYSLNNQLFNPSNIPCYLSLNPGDFSHNSGDFSQNSGGLSPNPGGPSPVLLAFYIYLKCWKLKQNDKK